MGKSWIVIQKPDSQYSDEEGVCYNYPTSIPNGRRVKKGDYLICSLTKKLAEDSKRIFGIGRIREIVKKGGSATAYYGWYKVFNQPFTYDEIGGDPRVNIQHSMNPIQTDREEMVLDILIGEAELDPVIKAKESDLEYKLTGKRRTKPRTGRAKKPQNPAVEQEATTNLDGQKLRLIHNIIEVQDPMLIAKLIAILLNKKLDALNVTSEENEEVNDKAYDLEEIRKTYPNAYTPWSSKDDSMLEQLYCENLSIRQLSIVFARNEGAIESRIAKLELAEKYE